MKLLFSGADIASPVANIGLTILRVFIGLAMAIAHGIGKVPPTERFVERVGLLGFPLPEVFAWAAGLSEFVGGVFLAAGLMTRPSAFCIAATMAVAAFLRHADDPFAVQEKALLFGCVAVAFVFIGSGKYGIDAILRQRQKT